MAEEHRHRADRWPKAGTRRSGRTALAGAMVVMAFAVTACRNTEPKLPGAPQVVQVTLTEYRVEYAGEIRRGRVVFELSNKGEENHGISLYGLPEDFPEINEQLQGTTRRALRTTIASLYDFPPGRTDTFAVDLTPGRYAMVCFERSPDGVAQSRKGMAVEFRVK